MGQIQDFLELLPFGVVAGDTIGVAFLESPFGVVARDAVRDAVGAAIGLVRCVGFIPGFLTLLAEACFLAPCIFDFGAMLGKQNESTTGKQQTKALITHLQQQYYTTPTATPMAFSATIPNGDSKNYNKKKKS
ncbi:hypothetical protein C2G38_2186704 [Gigaspora rosea]|uniref:Uncharacterized protein n=1 Tax=Gigaspora rosea TaxID=44941 RepID=A0A397V6I0_9GLOM|nr:hypothetical protein C2G38_2186704 [Gigaspora rosea]